MALLQGNVAKLYDDMSSDDMTEEGKCISLFV